MWIKMLFSAGQHMLLGQFIKPIRQKPTSVTKHNEYVVCFSSMHPMKVPSTQNSIPYSLWTELQLSYMDVNAVVFFSCWHTTTCCKNPTIDFLGDASTLCNKFWPAVFRHSTCSQYLKYKSMTARSDNKFKVKAELWIDMISEMKMACIFM